MGVSVPSNVVRYIQRASQGTGIGFQTVACQVNMESGFQQYVTSPTGAQGPYQFEPGTWASYGHGSPFDWAASTEAYIRFMNDLSNQFGGNIFDMLAAYNAGPGNIQAGEGYASAILHCAGAGVSIGRAQPQPLPQDVASPSGSGSTDDWSQKVRNSGSKVGDTGVQLAWASRAIERL